MRLIFTKAYLAKKKNSVHVLVLSCMLPSLLRTGVVPKKQGKSEKH